MGETSVGSKQSDFNELNAIIFVDAVTDDVISFQDDCRKAGYNYPIVVADSLGYKKEGIVSLYDSFLMNDDETGKSKQSIDLPLYDDSYQLCLYTGGSSAIDNGSAKIVSTYFEPDNVHGIYTITYKYLNDVSKIAFLEKYTSTGRVILRRIYDPSTNARIGVSYFNARGEEIIYIDEQLGIVSLIVSGKKLWFKSIIDFLKYSLEYNGFKDSSIIFDMLAYNSMVVGELNDHSNMYIHFNETADANCIQNITNVSQKHLRNCNTVIARHESALATLCKADYRDDMKLVCLPILKEKRSVTENPCNTTCVTIVDKFSVDAFLNLVKAAPCVTFYAVTSAPDDIIQKICDYSNIKLVATDRFLSKQTAIDRLSENNSVFLAINSLFASIKLPDNAVFIVDSTMTGYYRHNFKYKTVDTSEIVSVLMSYHNNVNVLKNDLRAFANVGSSFSVDNYKAVFGQKKRKSNFITLADLVNSCVTDKEG